MFRMTKFAQWTIETPASCRSAMLFYSGVDDVIASMWRNETSPTNDQFLSFIYSWNSDVALPSVTYVGSEACIDCHKAKKWKRGKVLTCWYKEKHATDAIPFSDFNDQTVTHKGKPNRFFAREKSLGQHRRVGWPIQKITKRHTFALELCNSTWLSLKTDAYSWFLRLGFSQSRTMAQRWFHLYPIPFNTDEFYRPTVPELEPRVQTAPTNPEKNYDSVNTYNTTWSGDTLVVRRARGPGWVSSTEQAQLAWS